METTKQFRKRNAILACLRGTTCHPSAEKLYQMLQQEHPDISLATVYRNLALFKSQGIIASVATVDGVERFDGNIEPHVHLQRMRRGAGCDPGGPAGLQQLRQVSRLPHRSNPIDFHGTLPGVLKCPGGNPESNKLKHCVTNNK